MSIDTSLSLRLCRYVLHAVIILSIIRLWTEEWNTRMITCTAGELLALQPTDVTIPRTVRKSIFGFRLWHWHKQWAQHHDGVSSCDGLPRTDTADHSQSREHTALSTVGSRNALWDCFWLSEYTLAVEQMRRCCRTVSWQAVLTTSGDAGKTWECLGGGQCHAVKSSVFNLFRSGNAGHR